MAKYKRNTYIINPKFQIKFSLYVMGFVFVSSIIYPITIYDLITNFVEVSQQHIPNIAQALEQKRTYLIIILGLWQLGFCALVFVSCIFFSHKIAGPLYKLQNFLRQHSQGIDHGKLRFRSGDYFHEIADDFNQAFENSERDAEQDLRFIDEASTYIKNLAMVVPNDKKVVLKEIDDKLLAISDRLKK